MKNIHLLPLVGVVLIVGCGVKSTVIPQNPENLDKIKFAVNKLSDKDQELLAGYIMRKTVSEKLGAMFGNKSADSGIPKGMTIGRAIAEQKKFLAEVEKEEKRKAEAREKIEKERELAMEMMRGAVSVELVSKRIVPADNYGLSENIDVVFEYQNNTDKDIMGVKGTIDIIDMFGEEITGFNISNEETIPAKGSVKWQGKRSVAYGRNEDAGKRWVGLPDEKFKIVWKPVAVIFKDGKKLTAPEAD